MQGQNLTKINDATINSLLSQSGLGVLLITSSWDGYGVIMQKLLEGLSTQYGKVFFGVVDVEESPRISKLFNVTNPPGLLFVRDGELIKRVLGTLGLGEIENLIEQNS